MESIFTSRIAGKKRKQVRVPRTLYTETVIQQWINGHREGNSFHQLASRENAQFCCKLLLKLR